MSGLQVKLLREAVEHTKAERQRQDGVPLSDHWLRRAEAALSGEVPAGLTREHLRTAERACAFVDIDGWHGSPDELWETICALRAALREPPEGFGGKG